jgi:hypothetical protein
MNEVKVVFEPNKLLGKAFKVYLLAGGKFNFKCTGAGKDYITGHDDEGLDIHLSITDIDFILI